MKTFSAFFVDSGGGTLMTLVVSIGCLGRMCQSKEDGGLGFRSLYEFNLTLLARQGWRLIQNPESLAARLLKAKYFSHNTFWQTSLGSSPSSCWRGIMEAHSILELGSRWRVGNGNSIRIWYDRWLDRRHLFRPLMRSSFIEVEYVSDLIDVDSASWNHNLVSNLLMRLR